MSAWLTFVVGIIIGLLAGWAIDVLYRRRGGSAEGELAPAQPALTPPPWAEPLPEAPESEEVAPSAAGDAPDVTPAEPPAEDAA